MTRAPLPRSSRATRAGEHARRPPRRNLRRAQYARSLSCRANRHARPIVAVVVLPAARLRPGHSRYPCVAYDQTSHDPRARIVEASDGCCWKIDVTSSRITMHVLALREGDVVSWARRSHRQRRGPRRHRLQVRGRHPSNELSIRKNVIPRRGGAREEVDALVLTKEDQDGRLIAPKKRAVREGMAQTSRPPPSPHGPFTGTVIEVVRAPDRGPRGSWLPAASLVRHPPGAQPRRVHGPADRVQSYRAQSVRETTCLSRRPCWKRSAREQRQEIPGPACSRASSSRASSRTSSISARSWIERHRRPHHISRLSWSHVNTRGEILNIGDTVQVKVPGHRP